MSRQNAAGNTGAKDSYAQLLRVQLQQNTLKLQQLCHEQALKLAELNKLNREIEELTRLYGGKKRLK